VKSELTIRCQLSIPRRMWIVDLVLENSPIQESGKRVQAICESPEAQGCEEIYPTFVVHDHIKEGA
jgi:hypothetical protein